MQLPGKAACRFRRDNARAVCRFLAGDLTLINEIENRHQEVQGTDLDTFLKGSDHAAGPAPQEQVCDNISDKCHSMIADAVR